MSMNFWQEGLRRGALAMLRLAGNRGHLIKILSQVADFRKKLAGDGIIAYPKIFLRVCNATRYHPS